MACSKNFMDRITLYAYCARCINSCQKKLPEAFILAQISIITRFETFAWTQSRGKIFCFQLWFQLKRT